MTASPHSLHILETYEMLPTQLDTSRELTSFQKLLYATIEEAQYTVGGHITGMLGNGPTRRYREATIALEWFCSDAETLFSFLYCCQHLNIDPRPIRQQAQRDFHKLIPPKPQKTGVKPEMRAFVHIIQSKMRHAERRPSWLPRVLVCEARPSYKRRVVRVSEHVWSKEEADRIARNYIESGVWRAMLQEEREAA